MSKNFDYSVNFSDELEKCFRESEFVGEGHNGVVFLLGENKVIKIFRKNSVCKDECGIMKRVSKSRFFPKLHETGERYMIREYVDGVRLDKYLRRKKLNRKLCEELYNMILDFEKLRFKRIDIRCKDIFIQKDFTLKIIDPKNNYKKKVVYPRHLFKGLYKRKELETFFEYVFQIDKARGVFWERKFEKYLENNDI